MVELQPGWQTIADHGHGGGLELRLESVQWAEGLEAESPPGGTVDGDFGEFDRAPRRGGSSQCSFDEAVVCHHERPSPANLLDLIPGGAPT